MHSKADQSFKPLNELLGDEDSEIRGTSSSYVDDMTVENASDCDVLALKHYVASNNNEEEEELDPVK